MSDRALRVLHELAGFQRLLPVPNRVAFSQHEGEWLNIEIFVDNASTLTREFTAENATLRCDANGLYVKPPPLEQTFQAGGQTIRRELLFNTTEAGSLVFREKYTATSRIFIIPVVGFGIRWSKLDLVGP